MDALPWRVKEIGGNSSSTTIPVCILLEGEGVETWYMFAIVPARGTDTVHLTSSSQDRTPLILNSRTTSYGRVVCPPGFPGPSMAISPRKGTRLSPTGTYG